MVLLHCNSHCTRWLQQRFGASVGSVPWGQGQVIGLVAVVDGSQQHNDDGVAGGGLGWHVNGHNGEDRKGREKKLDLASDVALLDKVDVLAAVPARALSIHCSQNLNVSHTPRNAPQRLVAPGIDADDPVNGRKAGVERHQPKPAAQHVTHTQPPRAKPKP